MNYFIVFIKIIVVFDLCCLAVYLGGDLISTLYRKCRKKDQPADLFDFEEEKDAPLSVDSIRLSSQSEISNLVREKIFPEAQETLDTLTETEQTAAALLLRAYIGYLLAEGPVDEQNFPLLMELLNCTEANPDSGLDIPGMMLTQASEKSPRREEYFSNYQRYRLMLVDKERVILACQVMINDLIGRLYRYDFRFGYDLELAAEKSLTKQLRQNFDEEWEVDHYASGDC